MNDMDAVQPVEPAAPPVRAAEIRRAAGRAAGLTLEEILDRAMDLIAEVGIERFSMRRLASDLGVTPMSLYHHVPSKDNLTLLLQQTIIDMLDVADDTLAWDERLRRSLRHSVAVAQKYRKLAIFSIEHPQFMSMHDPLFTELTEAVRAGGMPEDHLKETMTWLIGFFAGTVLMEGTEFHNKIDPDRGADSDLAIELIIDSVRSQIAKYTGTPAPRATAEQGGDG